jgi:hypothetical protein
MKLFPRRATEPEEYSRSSMDVGEHSTYGSRSSVDVQTPLMQEMHTSMDQDEVGGEDDESQSRISTQPNGHRVNASIDSVATSSADTHGSRNSTTQLLTSANGAPADAIDERGEAPPYTERPEPSAASTPANYATTEDHRSVASRIMPSGLRNLFSGTRAQPPVQAENSDSLVPMVSITEAPPVGSNASSRRIRADTEATIPDSGSVPALLLSRSRSPPNSRIALTRPLTNNSSSTSLHARFTHQRNRSGSSLSPSVNNVEGSNANSSTRLTSPSSTSINSALISSPLAHTVTRTEFRFPKSGPTPQQLKFLSSRESLGRFGVPFGEDAERNYPNTRPPPFEATPGAGASTSSSRVGSGHGTSNSNPENTTRGEETAQAPAPAPAPARARPASWWRNLMQPAGSHDPSKEPPSPDTANVPAASAPEPEAEPASNAGIVAAIVAVPPPPNSNGVTTDDDSEFEPAALVPHPASARQSLAIFPSLSGSPGEERAGEEESSRNRRPVSRANTVSSTHTNVTYLTAVDTVHPSSSSSSSSSGTETEYYGDDREGAGDEEAPATPTMVPQRSLAPPSAPSSIHEDIDDVPRATPTGNAAPVPSGTTVSAH